MANFLLEIGCEELPAQDIPTGMEQLEQVARENLAKQRLEFKQLDVFGTPRRLAILVHGLAAKQQDLEEWVRGPSAAIAYDDDGSPTRAALGFARSQGTTAEELETRETEDGQYVFAHRHQPGRPAAEVLLEQVPGWITSIHFPRTMYWDDPGVRFSRPIRWLTALLDEEVVPLEFAALKAGRQSYGHRLLHPGSLTLDQAGTYSQAMREGKVIASWQERRQLIAGQLEQAAAEGAAVVVDQALLDEVTGLVEFPTTFVGSFPSSYLDLPRPVLETSMAKHQRYFPLQQGDDSLAPHFAAVRNGDDQHLDTVRRGNERVLNARLADASFLYQEDRKRSLEDYLEELDGIIYLENLGTLRDKSERLRQLCQIMGESLAVNGALRERLDRAAVLSKADLATSMVGEFSSLQGIIGGHYARLSGEAEQVAQAIEEQYLPGGQENALPQTLAGSLLSVADKLDALAGCFAAGLEPSGSSDPLGLRRAALGLLAILREAQLDLNLPDLLADALRGYNLELDASEQQAVLERLLDFIKRRLEGLLAEADFDPSIIAAVLAAGIGTVPGVWDRAQALASLAQKESLYDDVMVVYTRTFPLGQKADTTSLRPELFDHPAERQLASESERALEQAEQALADGDLAYFYRSLASLRPAVDNFLDEVLVMAEDPAVRANRLALLARISTLLVKPADPGQLPGGRPGSS